MSAPQNTHSTLTIEFTDAQGQVQRTEQLSGSHFTLRVRSDALSVIHSEAPLAESHTPTPSTHATSPAALASQGWRGIKPWAWALILWCIFAVLTSLQLWVEYNPDNATQNLVALALGLTAGIALWAAFWALLGKIFAKHAAYWQHVCLVLISGIVLTVLVAVMHFLSFSLSWRVLGRMDILSSVAALSLLIWAHLRLIVPAQRSKALRAGMVSFTLVSVVLVMWTNHRRSDTVLDTFHSPHLYRPALQMSSAQTSSSFFEEAKALEAILKTKAGETEPGEDSLDPEEN
jgi:hypothetical protein